jgi:ketosteroid isomerase-like protein
MAASFPPTYDQEDPAIQEILEAEQAWVQALRDMDLAALEALMAEDYTQILHDGSVIGKQEALASFQSQQRHWDYADSSGHMVRAYGDCAVLVGLWSARGENHGVAFDYQARFMAVYVRRSGNWQLVADQSTPLKAAE